MLWVVWGPPAKVIVVDWYFGFPVGVESSVIVLSELYPEIVVSFCDEFYRELPMSWLVNVIACLGIGPSFDKRVFLKICVSFDICGKVVCLSSVDCFLCVG